MQERACTQEKRSQKGEWESHKGATSSGGRRPIATKFIKVKWVSSFKSKFKAAFVRLFFSSDTYHRSIDHMLLFMLDVQVGAFEEEFATAKKRFWSCARHVLHPTA
jgi:hypothetical protein